VTELADQFVLWRICGVPLKARFLFRIRRTIVAADRTLCTADLPNPEEYLTVFPDAEIQNYTIEIYKNPKKIVLKIGKKFGVKNTAKNRVKNTKQISC